MAKNVYSHLCYHQKCFAEVVEICLAMDFLSKYFDFCIIKTSCITNLDLLSKRQ